MAFLARTVALLAVPCGLFALAAAVAGFAWRPLQPVMLAAGAAGMAVACTGLASGGMFAPLLVLPLAIAYGLAACASLLLGALMEDGYRCEAALAAREEDR